MGQCILLAAIAAAALPGAPAAGELPSATDAPYTAKDQETFGALYGERIRQAASRTAKTALAKELLAGAGSLEGGLKYLLLKTAKDLALAGGETALAVQAAEQIVELKRGDPKPPRRELLELQVKHFWALGRKPVHPKHKAALLKEIRALGEKIADGAIALGNMHRSDAEFAEAEAVEKLAVRVASRASSPRLPRLRQGILVSQALKGLVAQAKRYVNLGRTAEAQWAYVDAGLYREAAKLNPDKQDKTVELILRVAGAEEPKPAGLFEAAKAWDQRAVGAAGAIQQLRLARAAELYERYMTVSDGADRDVARLRLQAIHRQLGEMLSALRKPAEWLYLADIKPDSVRVGWGSFRQVTAAKGPIGIAGRKFLTGLYAHASSRIVYSLRGRYKQLSTCYGLTTGAGGAASFHVVCDGKTVFNSPGTWSVHKHGIHRPVVVDLVGVDKLELVTKGIAGGAGAHSAWGDPKVR